MRFNIHAGHNADGQIACGAVGFVKESVENRIVKDLVIRKLILLGHEAYDCTVDAAHSVTANLDEIVAKCNEHEVDADVSIHFNTGANDPNGNGKTTGTEVWIYNQNSPALKYAQNVVNAFERIGFKNRGVKVNPKYRVLNSTKSPALLIECCFIDDKDDVERYNAEEVSDAIVFGLTGQKYSLPKVDTVPPTDGSETPVGTTKKLKRVQVGAYAVTENAERMKQKLLDAGFDAIIVDA